MEGRAKVTKEVLCEEARFILANVMAEARYGRQNRYDDIRRVCEGAVSIPFAEYIGFLEKSGYLRHDRTSESLEVTAELGRSHLRVSELLALEPGSVIGLERAAGSPVDLLVNGSLFARAEVIVEEGRYAVRITELVGNGITA